MKINIENEFSKNVVAIISKIPKGKVLTYGKIAELADHPRAARQVVKILKKHSSEYKLPWHRVVSSTGKITIKDEIGKNIQKELLENEGVIFEGDKFRLKEYLWI